jgi:23S rRNA (adenine2503-C2)-methyltransferase
MGGGVYLEFLWERFLYGGFMGSVIKNISVPTGNICIYKGEKGYLEFLSIGDYGKEKNLKADFMGLKKEINGVPHGELLPLTEKWVITISTQYGCSMGCKFCDVPKVGKGVNATYNDLVKQVLNGIYLHPEIEHTKRLNVHFARMGEPTWNPNVLDATRWMKDHLDNEYKVHPVVSTMMPKNNEWLRTFIHAWMRIKNRLFHGNAGLQLSINSTDEDERNKMFSGNCLSLYEIRKIMTGIIPNGRKITLNFALAGYRINEKILKKYFDPDDYLVKLTPMHQTNSCKKNNLITPNGYDYFYPYKKVEERLKDAGFDVIVFVPSKEEDESRITCGNALLADKNFVNQS